LDYIHLYTAESMADARKSTRRLIEVNAPQTHCSSSSGTGSPSSTCDPAISSVCYSSAEYPELNFTASLQALLKTVSTLCTTPRLGPRIVSSRDDFIQEIGTLSQRKARRSSIETSQRASKPVWTDQCRPRIEMSGYEVSCDALYSVGIFSEAVPGAPMCQR
jgi:hypothetical protein